MLFDEPELGLHPYALSLLGSLIQKAVAPYGFPRNQLIISTQSAPLLNEFVPEDIVIVERSDGQSVFRRLESSQLSDWLSDYTLGELWQKNLLGGRPHRLSQMTPSSPRNSVNDAHQSDCRRANGGVFCKKRPSAVPLAQSLSNTPRPRCSRPQGRERQLRPRQKDILIQLKQDRTACCSTMLDLYGLGPGFPGMPIPRYPTGLAKAEHIEQAMARDIGSEGGDLRPDLRFIPYLQVHEYEGLLFSDPEAFAAALRRNDLSERLTGIRKAFSTPEDINDNPNTAPSKQILRVYPQYKKVIEGTTAARMVGIDSILRECPHFRRWVERLSALASPL